MEGRPVDLEEVVDSYFAAIRARDIDALMSLYADDATFILPDGREFVGTAAIRAMHLGVFTAGAPVPTPGLRILAGAAAAVEIETRIADGSLRRTTNHYSLNDAGKIERLNVYVKTD
jgi:uncharacterized protein (TIGR02246 family)